MKKKVFYILSLCILFFFGSCDYGVKVPSDSGSNNESDSGDASNQEGDNQSGASKPDDENVFSIVLKNDSFYSVSVYLGHPSYTSAPYTEIPAKSSVEKQMDYVQNVQTFYFVYNLDFGIEGTFFPYYPSDEAYNHKSITVKNNEINECVIDEIQKCETNSSYLFLENNTTSDIYLLLADGSINPYGKDNKFIKPNSTGVYEIGEYGNILPEVIGNVKIIADAVEYELPKVAFEKGNIYTINVSLNEKDENKIVASEKAVTPFDIDTIKKFWSLDNKIFKVENEVGPVLKPSYDLNEGSLIMGVVSGTNDFGILKIDEYGSSLSKSVYSFGLNFESLEVVSANLLDGFEQSDGSVVMLVQYEFEDYYSYYVLCYDYKEKSLKFSKEIYYEDFDMLFRNGSKNIICHIEDNKVIVAGALCFYDEENVYYQPGFVYLDFTEKKRDGSCVLKEEKIVYLSDEKFENESMATSALFDGTDIYLSGYLNCDFLYSDVEHEGVVYKVNKDTFVVEQIYNERRCLFLSIDKHSESSVWYVCGEYWSKDGLLRGVVTNKNMVEEESFPITYTGSKEFTWFNQLCAYENKVVVCGEISETQGGSNSKPVILSYDKEGERLWENLSFEAYENALDIIPNSIGTYLVQLSKGNIIHYVNADLLGCERDKE